MGIQGLNKNLLILKKLLPFQTENNNNNNNSSFDKMLRSIRNNDPLKDVTKTLEKDEHLSLTNKSITLFRKVRDQKDSTIYHIDFSIVLHKAVETCVSMDDVYNKIRGNILNIKNTSKLLLYLDPDIIKIKKKLRKERKKLYKESTKDKKSNIDNKLIQVSNLTDIVINNHIKELLNLNKTALKKTYEEYLEDMEYFNTHTLLDFVDVEKKDNKNFFDAYSGNEEMLTIMNNINTSLKIKEHDEENEIDDTDIDLSEETTFDEPMPTFDEDDFSNFYEYENGDLDFIPNTDDIKESKVTFLPNKEIFSLLVAEYPFCYHTQYIIDRLLNEKIISLSELKKCDYIDAEIYMVSHIQKHYSNFLNVIVSNDQDVLLFALNHITDPIIFLTHTLTFNINKHLALTNDIVAKNIAYLTFIFNKTDYFPGIQNLSISLKRLVKLESISILEIDYKEDYKALVSAWIKVHKIKYKSENIFKKDKLPRHEMDLIEMYNNLFDQIKRFLNIDLDFFNSELQINNGYEKNELCYYLDKCYNPDPEISKQIDNIINNLK